MNLFVTSECPAESANNLDDKRIVNHCRECAQIITTALSIADLPFPQPAIAPSPYAAPSPPKKHMHHPVPKWVARSRENYLWTVRHFAKILDEYNQRYHKTHIYHHLVSLYLKMGQLLPSNGLQPFQNSAANKSKNIDCTHISNAVIAYREYMIKRWETDTRQPTWYGDINGIHRIAKYW